MPKRMLLALLLMTAAIGPASAQDDNERGGVRTETQSRLNDESSNDMLWNALGLLGLVGLVGFRRRHSDDSYHPAPLE